MSGAVRRPQGEAVHRPYLLAFALATILSVALFASAAAGSGSRTAAPPFVDGVALVQFAPGTPGAAKAAARAGVGATLDATFELVPGLERLKLRGRDVGQAVEALAKNPNVTYAEPDYVVTASVTPNDPLFPQLWGMSKINAP